MKVLVVDDNADMRESLALVLESAGYETRTAPDGNRALALHGQRPVDLLITDIFMPGADGIETIARFRARSLRLKIVAMSGGGEIARGDYLSVAADIGAHAVLRKPFDPEDLLRTLQRLELNDG